MSRPTPKPKKIEPKDIVYIEHYFNDWEADTKNLTLTQEGIYSRLRRLYFKTADKNNGRIGNDFDLLCFRIGCHTDDERADLSLVLKDKFKIINKSYRHSDWDKQIKNIQFKIDKTSNAGENCNAKSNAGNGGNVTPNNIAGNDTSNAHIYDNTDGFVMTGAERTEKSRKLKTLIKQGFNADKSMSLDEIRVLYDTHFHKNHSPCNATPAPSCNENGNENLDDCNADGNASNAQIRENKPIPNNQESKANECVNSQALHARTHTNFSQNLKSIGGWQKPELDTVNFLLQESGFGRSLEQGEYTQMFTKFVNYNVSRELQGAFLATEQVRIDKLIDWIKREKPAFNTPTPSTEIYTQSKNIDKNTMVWVNGFYKPCFDGYTPAECTKIIKEYRMAGESTLEAYERIKLAGVENCKKHEVASPEFVAQMFANNPLLQRLSTSTKATL